MKFGLGTHAAFGHPVMLPTFFPHGDGTPSRTTFILVSIDFLPFVTDFTVTSPADIPVHACLQINSGCPIQAPTKTIVVSPASLHDHVLNVLRHKHGLGSIQDLTNKKIGEGRQIRGIKFIDIASKWKTLFPANSVRATLT